MNRPLSSFWTSESTNDAGWPSLLLVAMDGGPGYSRKPHTQRVTSASSSSSSRVSSIFGSSWSISSGSCSRVRRRVSGGSGCGSSEESERGVVDFCGDACLLLEALMALSVICVEEVEEDDVPGVMEVLGGSCVIRALDERRGDIDLAAREIINHRRRRRSSAMPSRSGPSLGAEGVGRGVVDWQLSVHGTRQKLDER